MGLLATFTIETPILRETLVEVPEMTLRTEELHWGREESSKGIVWAEGEAYQTFERALEADSTVAGYRLLTEVENRRLYRVTYSETADDYFTYPVAVEHDVTLLSLRGTHEQLEIRARFPDRDSLIAYREACKERDVPFHLEKLYREEQIVNDGGVGNRYGVTTAQREALLQALQMGYFDVPRQTTLEEIAEGMGISNQALSTRLRRAEKNLLRNTLAE